MAIDAPVIIQATDLVVRYNNQTVLDRASLTIGEGARVGLVGRNGCGKSTFLKILTGEVIPDSGSVTFRRGLVLGNLPQECPLDPEKNVYENIRAGAHHVLNYIAEFESLPVHSNRHSVLEERINALDGWTLDNRISTAMTHLNTPDGERRIDTLSGGERRRVALCRAIVANPDLLVLDEPTNHLDPEAIEWVSQFLENYRGTFIAVTHDRYFLDRLASVIVELSNGNFYFYDGNYTEFLISKAERQAAEEIVEHKRQMFIRRELDWVRRGPSARRTKSKSRLEHYFEVASQAAPEIEKDVDLVIPPPPQLGNRVLELSNVGMEFNGRVLFEDFSFLFENGQKIGVAGRNGLGKTTLLQIIVGLLTPTSGSVKLGPLTRFNYVDQGRLQLREERTVVEEISDGTEFVLFGEHKLSLRAYLKRFLFADDRINTQVKYLSGGERSRLLLARILKNGGNFLILDEPTNDLDLSTLRVLEEALIDFPGVVIVVSHDRYFLNRTCNGILAFEGNGQIVYNVGNYDYYLEKKSLRSAASDTEFEQTETTEKRQSETPASTRPRKLTWKESRELESMESKITELENDIARIEALFTKPDYHKEHGEATPQLVAQLEQSKEMLTALYSRWEELEVIQAASNKTSK